MADYNSAYTGAQIDAAISKANSAQQPPAEGAFVDGDKTKLDGIEAGADATDTANVTAAGALMDSEVTNLAAVKAFDPTDYATAAQGALADTATQPGDDASTLGSGAATDGYVLTADGAGGTAWEAASGGGGSPAGSSGQFQFNDSGVFAAADLWQETNVIEQRNGTNTQVFNLYNTYTDASNYERGFMKWNSNVLEIGIESAGTGSSLRGFKAGNYLGYMEASNVGGMILNWHNTSLSFNYRGSAQYVMTTASLYSTSQRTLGKSDAGWGGVYLEEVSSDPADPSEGLSVMWQSDGTGSGDDGDIMMKVTAGGVTKTVTLVDFSAA